MRLNMSDWRIAIAIFVMAGISIARADIVCQKCRDTGVIYKPCDVCHGTKYVWKCSAPSRPSNYYFSGENHQSNGDGYCGYGSIYTPLHENCKGTRKRINCPNCAKGKARMSSTGKVAVTCPACHGKGKRLNEGGMFYIIRDASYISDEDREYVFLRMDKPGQENAASHDVRSRIFKKFMDQKEIEDFKVIYTRSKVFNSLDELKDFMRNSVNRSTNDNPCFYIVKDAERVTANDRRMVFEMLGDEHMPYSENLIQRRQKLTEQDIEDFKVVYPRCRVFGSIADLKSFMRTVSVVEGESESRSRIYPESRRRIYRTREEPSQNDAVVPSEPAPRKALTNEEINELIRVEMEHEKEMIQRKLGK